jgi:hypothetical protein
LEEQRPTLERPVPQLGAQPARLRESASRRVHIGHHQRQHTSTELQPRSLSVADLATLEQQLRETPPVRLAEH